MRITGQKRKVMRQELNGFAQKVLVLGFLCAISVSSVSLWCGFTRNSSTTETQRLHREERDRDFLCKALCRIGCIRSMQIFLRFLQRAVPEIAFGFACDDYRHYPPAGSPSGQSLSLSRVENCESINLILSKSWIECKGLPCTRLSQIYLVDPQSAKTPTTPVSSRYLL